MTLKQLYNLVGLEFLHEMTPFDVVSKPDNENGVVEFGDLTDDGVESIGIRLGDQGEYIAKQSDFDSFELKDNKEIMFEFWAVTGAGVNIEIKR